MTFIEPRQPACPGPKCLAQVVNRIQAVPGNVGEWRPAVVRDSPRPEGPSHAGPSWLKMLTKESVHKSSFSVHTEGNLHPDSRYWRDKGGETWPILVEKCRLLEPPTPSPVATAR